MPRFDFWAFPGYNALMKQLEYTVPAGDAGLALGRVVRGRMGVSARQLARAKALDAVFVNGQPRHADYRVAEGDRVTLELNERPPAFCAQPEDAPCRIVYEDEDIYVIDKPAPLAVQSSPRQENNTLENRLAGYFHSDGFIFRPVNRLDKGTSGLMAAAKHAHAQMALAKQLHTPSFVREYLALTERAPEADEGVIDLPIGKADGATVKRCIRDDGKPSLTHYRVLERESGAALLRLRLETGRTHQIRVHLSAIGCPVLGDFLYGQELPDLLPGRFALHSAYMRFVHPLSGKIMELESPLPEELISLLRSCRSK